MIEGREYDQGDEQGYACCHGRDHDRFTQELTDEVDAARPQHLADADLTGTGSRPCGGQVHEVDTGDEQDEDGDGAEDIDVFDVAVVRELVGTMGMEMDIRERSGVEPK